MKREYLKGLGLTDDQINAIMSEHGSDIESHKTTITTLRGELTTANAGLTEALDKLKPFDGVDVAKLNQDIKDWETKYNTDLTNTKRDFALQGEFAAHKVKDSKSLMPHLDMAKIKYEGDKLSGLKEQLEPLKKDKAFLFDIDTTPQGKYVPQGSGSSHGSGAGDKFDADSALRASMGLPPITP